MQNNKRGHLLCKEKRDGRLEPKHFDELYQSSKSNSRASYSNSEPDLHIWADKSNSSSQARPANWICCFPAGYTVNPSPGPVVPNRFGIDPSQNALCGRLIPKRRIFAPFGDLPLSDGPPGHPNPKTIWNNALRHRRTALQHHGDAFSPALQNHLAAPR